MWLKLCGLLILGGTGTYYGFYRAARYIARTQQLRQLMSFLQALEMHIAYAGTILPQALAQAAATVHDPVAAVFRTVAYRVGEAGRLTPSQALTQTLREKSGDLALQAPELDVLAHLGECLGRSDRQDQVKHLRLAQQQLLVIAQEAAIEQERNVRLWRYLGACSGAAMVILLL